MSGPSFQWFLSFSTGSFLLRGSCATCDSDVTCAAGCQPCSPRYRVRDNQYRYQIDNGTLLFYSLVSRSELVASDRSTLLGFRLLQSIGTSTEYRRSTAAVVPSYLVRQRGVALVEFVQWRPIRNRLDTHSLAVNRLYDSNASIVSLPMSTPCSLVELSYSLVWSSGAIDHRLQLHCFLLLLLLILAIDCEQLDTTNR